MFVLSISMLKKIVLVYVLFEDDVMFFVGILLIVLIVMLKIVMVRDVDIILFLKLFCIGFI